MEQSKRLELDILLFLRNNKTVPTPTFHELFQENWNLYRAKLNELIINRFIKVSTLSAGICAFDLSAKGEQRIWELVTEGAKENRSVNSRAIAKDIGVQIHSFTN